MIRSTSDNTGNKCNLDCVVPRLPENKDMPWYTWIFDGVGAAVFVPVATWAITRLHRSRAGSAGPVAPAPPVVPAVSPVTQVTGQAVPVLAATRGQGQGLIDYLLAIQEMQEPGFRRLVYASLPPAVAQQLEIGNRARIELISLIDTFGRYPHLQPWQALQGRMNELLPDNPSVKRLAAELARLGLIARPG